MRYASFGVSNTYYQLIYLFQLFKLFFRFKSFCDLLAEQVECQCELEKLANYRFLHKFRAKLMGFAE